jgi:hypothetical protein
MIFEANGTRLNRDSLFRCLFGLDIPEAAVVGSNTRYIIINSVPTKGNATFSGAADSDSDRYVNPCSPVDRPILC